MLQDLEIVVLAENRVGRGHPDLMAENGLSLYVTSPEGDFLFDTGLINAFLVNADLLGIDLGKKVHQIVFSHGHRDHTGGIYAYLKKFKQADMICHFNIFNRKFRVLKGGRLEVGIPFEQNQLSKLGGKFNFKTHPCYLSENVLTLGEIPKKTAFEMPSQNHQQLVLQNYLTDELHDDTAMVIKTAKGLVILLGDAHSGVINTVDYAMKITATRGIHCIMGGMNLVEASETRIRETVAELKKLDPQFIVPLHSTGFRAMNELFNAFGERMLQKCTGGRFILENG